MSMTERTKKMVARAKVLLATHPRSYGRMLVDEFGVSIGYAHKMGVAAKIGCSRHASRMATRQALRRGQLVVKAATPAARSKPVAMLDRVAEIRHLMVRYSRRVTDQYVMGRYGVSRGYACRIRQLARMSPDDAAELHEAQIAMTREWLARKDAEDPGYRQEAARRWRAANPERVRAHGMASRQRSGPARIVRERGVVPIADAIHRQLASMLPGGMPTVIADEIVAAAWLAVAEGADMDEAIRIGRRSARGLMEFEFRSLDAPIGGDASRTMMDLVGDDGAEDEDAILDRLDREREWRQAA